MTGSLEDLEKKFILDEDAGLKNIEGAINRISAVCRLDKTGGVTFMSLSMQKKLTVSERTAAILAARYLASQLQKKLGKEVSISEVVKSSEIANMLREQKNIIDARLKELKDSKKAILVSKGAYKVAPYSIDDILDSIEQKIGRGDQ